ncbi:MAG: CDP-alcohol phosphatidyltransferase family protein [Ilumatobacteraceae bacterium]
MGNGTSGAAGARRWHVRPTVSSRRPTPSRCCGCAASIFCWLLFGRDDQVAAAWLLGGLGATDWVDGWRSRRFDQVSEFGKIFDPTADRLLFIVAIGSILLRGHPRRS